MSEAVNKPSQTAINPALKNLYFSMLEGKTIEEMKIAKLDYGNLVEMIFILTEKKNVQRMYFDKKEFVQKLDEVELTIADVKTFTDSINWDIEKELPKVKSIFIKMDFKQQLIFLTKNNLDGTIEETSF